MDEDVLMSPKTPLIPFNSKPFDSQRSHFHGEASVIKEDISNKSSSEIKENLTRNSK